MALSYKEMVNLLDKNIDHFDNTVDDLEEAKRVSFKAFVISKVFSFICVSLPLIVQAIYDVDPLNCFVISSVLYIVFLRQNAYAIYPAIYELKEQEKWKCVDFFYSFLTTIYYSKEKSVIHWVHHIGCFGVLLMLLYSLIDSMVWIGVLTFVFFVVSTVTTFIENSVSILVDEMNEGVDKENSDD